jgi:hypothetical protein
MANLRGGVTSDRREGSTASRLATNRIQVWANTWKRYIIVELYRDGLCNIKVEDDWQKNPKLILSVSLPANEGEWKDEFTPTIIFKGRDLKPEMVAAELSH